MSRNVAASVHQRLLNHSRAAGGRFNDVLQRYTLERWLYRLSVSDHADRFILKGGLMLLAWKLPVTRPTKDIDMLARAPNDLEHIRDLIIDICAAPVDDDGLVFDREIVNTQRIVEDALYEGVRATFVGFLATAKVAMQVDLGFNDVITPGPVSLQFPTILDQPAPQLNAYNPETTIAEKFEAMVKLGELNSRMKDFFYVWSLAENHAFRGASLADAIAHTFARRETRLSEESACFANHFGTSSDKQRQWQAFAKRSQLTDCAPATFEEVWNAVMSFLKPMTQADATKLRWPAGGPWTR
jgi:predicted nucleotidyltransferase component of viral defense system